MIVLKAMSSWLRISRLYEKVLFKTEKNSIETRKMIGLALPKTRCDWTSEWLVISSLVSRDEPKRWVAFNQSMPFFHEGQQECPFPHLLRPTAIFVGWIQTQEGLLFSVRSSFQKHGVGLFIFQSEKGCCFNAEFLTCGCRPEIKWASVMFMFILWESAGNFFEMNSRV